MRRLFSKWTVFAVVLSLSVAMSCSLFRRATLRPPANLSPDQKSLFVANAYAKLGNWEAAGPIFARLEKRFHDSGDRRNELYAHVSRLRAEEEYSDLQQLSNVLRQILLRPDVQNDLELQQRVLEVKGSVDLNLDGVSARGPFEELERVAGRRRDSDAESRASGELGIIAFLEGNASEAKRRVLWAIAQAYAHGDAGGKIRYWSLLGQGLVEHGRAAEALSHLDRAIKIAGVTCR
jgi:tetratricopeptide (TPR) repeat protein